MRLLNDLIGKEVLDHTALVIGKVKDVEIDTSSNKNESIIISKGGTGESIGISKAESLVPFEMINRIGDKVILKKAINEAEQLVEELENEI